MLEYWHKKREPGYPTKNIEYTFLMMVSKHLFSGYFF